MQHESWPVEAVGYAASRCVALAAGVDPLPLRAVSFLMHGMRPRPASQLCIQILSNMHNYVAARLTTVSVVRCCCCSALPVAVA